MRALPQAALSLSFALINWSLSICLVAHPKGPLVQKEVAAQRADGGIVRAAMRQLSTILLQPCVGLRRHTFSSSRKYAKRRPGASPLGIPKVKYENCSSVFGTRVSNGRIIGPARPLLRCEKKSLPFLWSALCCKCCRILFHQGTPKENHSF